jgi:hypothetical protein
MDTNCIKNNVVPILIESIGNNVINKRNKLGKVYSLEKHNPTAFEYLKNLSEETKNLSIKERYNIDTYVTSVKNSHVYGMILPLMEKALETGNIETILQARSKMQSLLVQYKV